MYQNLASEIETVIGKAGLKISMKEITAPDLSVPMEVNSMLIEASLLIYFAISS
jgi:hypothetical protein